MNLGQLRTEVYDRLGVPETDGQYPAAVLTRAVNAALNFIEAEQDWPWLTNTATLTTAAGTGDYLPPADWSRTVHLQRASYEKLQRVSIGELDSLWDPTTSGPPEAWCPWSERIFLRPVPDAAYAYTHRYIKVDPALVADADTPLMPARFHVAIAEIATWFLLRRSKEDGRAIGAKAAYDEWRARMADDRRRWSGPSKVKLRSRP